MEGIKCRRKMRSLCSSLYQKEKKDTLTWLEDFGVALASAVPPVPTVLVT